MDSEYYIHESDFRILVPDLILSESDSDDYNSRQITGIMSTETRDRQDEIVLAKGLDFNDFIDHGHFNDNHSQQTSAIVGYPEKCEFKKDLGNFDKKLDGISGWTCKGYILKNTSRADEIWELAKALQSIPDKKLGFSIEGKVTRRSDKTVEKAKIRNVAITNCPVNTDATWNVFSKSFFDKDAAVKALSAGFATSPQTQTGGGAMRSEDLDADVKENLRLKKKKKKAEIERALSEADNHNDLVKAISKYAMDRRFDISERAAATFAHKLLSLEKRI